MEVAGLRLMNCEPGPTVTDDRVVEGQKMNRLRELHNNVSGRQNEIDARQPLGIWAKQLISLSVCL